MAVVVTPMKVHIPQAVLDDLRQRLGRTRWPGEIAGTGWQRGTDLAYLKELVAYWLEEYDWRREEARHNTFAHFRAEVDGLMVQFTEFSRGGRFAIHERAEEMAGDLRKFFRPLRKSG